MIRITFASLAGGLVLFLWGSFVHVLSGWYDAAFDRFPDEQSVFDVIEQHAPTGGLFFLPHETVTGESSAMEVFLNARPAMAQPELSAQLTIGLLTNVLSVFLAVGLFSITAASSYWQWVKAFTVTGLLIGFVPNAYYWNWFGFPLDYSVLSVLDAAAGWALAGLAVARFVSGEK